MRTGIILAGGRSRRFGDNKLAADLGGTSLLEAAIAAVAAVTDGVIVAGPGLPMGFRAGETPVALIRDTDLFAGPLAALTNVLGRAEADVGHLAIVVGGDMPRLVPAVLRSMLDHLTPARAIGAVLLERLPPTTEADDGQGPRRAVLPVAVRVDAALRAATSALDSGHRSLQALLDRLTVAEVPGSVWRALDPEANTLLDVDTTADLEQIRHHDLR